MDLDDPWGGWDEPWQRLLAERDALVTAEVAAAVVEHPPNPRRAGHPRWGARGQ